LPEFEKTGCVQEKKSANLICLVREKKAEVKKSQTNIN
jgi:hypothetical protein